MDNIKKSKINKSSTVSEAALGCNILYRRVFVLNPAE